MCRILAILSIALLVYLTIAMLADQVIASLTIDQRMATTGETLVVVGHRGGADTFPYGYFDTWRLEVNPGRFAMV